MAISSPDYLYNVLALIGWCKETSSKPDEYNDLENPSLGQCAVTALIVQDIFGGRLLRGLANGESHYWNELPDGTEIDLTKDQFPDNVSIVGKEERTREYVLSFPDTVRRYEFLKKTIDILRNHGI